MPASVTVRLLGGYATRPQLSSSHAQTDSTAGLNKVTAMAMAMAFLGISVFLCVSASVSLGQEEIQLIIVNNCNASVWPALLGGAGHHSPEGGGFRLATGEEAVFSVPSGWSGRIWGRQGCCFDDDGKGSCESGDCAGLFKCGGVAGSPPATMVEMTLGTAGSALHYYDVSLVDGFNLPVAMVPVGGGAGCGTAGCEVDLNVCCPSRFEVRKGGKVVGCQSACQALKTDKYCCTGEFASPKSCRPTLFSKMFKSLCPRAYSFAYDDSSSLRTCRASRYLITFCPPKR